MIRRPLPLLLPLALLLAGCTDGLLPTAAPDAPLFVQVPGGPVVNSLLDDVVPTEEDPGCTDAKCTLRSAIAFASAGATITFSIPGTVTLTQGHLEIRKDLTISGPGAASLTVTGNNASGVFFIFSQATVTLSQLTITGGQRPHPLFRGIAIYNAGGTLTLTHSIVSGNRDGGIYNAAHGRLTVSHSIVSGNETSGGGGIFNEGTLTVSHSTISENWGSPRGGGIYNSGTLTLSHSTVSGNRVTPNFLVSAEAFGGGIDNAGTLTLIHSTVSGNRAVASSGLFGGTGFGGGLSNFGTLTLIHSTVSGNSAGTNGGGVFNRGTLSIANSILANSTTDGSPGGDCVLDGEASVFDSGYNLVGDGTCRSDPTSLAGDPLLGPLADNGGPTRTHALLVGSPALDAIPFGSNGCGLSTDQRGFPRPQPSGGNCDIGAFEVQPPTLSINANGTLTKSSGVATLSGTASCSSPVAVTLNVSLSQTQTKGKNTTTVSGSGSTSVSCTGSTAWTVTVPPESGKFTAGAADATAEAGGASASQRVQLK